MIKRSQTVSIILNQSRHLTIYNSSNTKRGNILKLKRIALQNKNLTFHIIHRKLCVLSSRHRCMPKGIPRRRQNIKSHKTILCTKEQIALYSHSFKVSLTRVHDKIC